MALFACDASTKKEQVSDSEESESAYSRKDQHDREVEYFRVKDNYRTQLLKLQQDTTVEYEKVNELDQGGIQILNDTFVGS